MCPKIVAKGLQSVSFLNGQTRNHVQPPLFFEKRNHSGYSVFDVGVDGAAAAAVVVGVKVVVVVVCGVFVLLPHCQSFPPEFWVGPQNNPQTYFRRQPASFCSVHALDPKVYSERPLFSRNSRFPPPRNSYGPSDCWLIAPLCIFNVFLFG